MDVVRAETRILLSTMRELSKDSSIARAFLSLQKQSSVGVALVIAQESQRLAAGKLFPSAEFQVRGLGEWPRGNQVEYSRALVSLYSRISSSPGFSDLKRNVLASLNRHDASGTFRLVDREIYFEQSLLEILSLLIRNRITHLFFDITPHVSRDYMMFWVAKSLGLRILFLQPIPWAGLALLRRELHATIPPNRGIWSHQTGTSASAFFNYSVSQGNALINNLKESNASWVASYQAPEIRKLSQGPPSPLKLARAIRQSMISGNSVSFSGMMQTGLGDRLLAVFLEWRLRRDLREQRRLINSRNHSNTPEYMFLALTHEPERTFFPEALPFDSQFEVALRIAENLEPGYKLLVKEHETQFVPGRRGYASRSIWFYSALDKVENIEIVPSSSPSNSLVKGSSGVISATGTICIEAALQGKPSYYFGNPWWEGFPGTTRIFDFSEISPGNCSIPSEKAIDRWLTGLVANCIPSTANLDAGEFSKKFAEVPEYFRRLEEHSLRETLQDFLVED